ncbi:16S rRNA (uracil(1498)-N(3))-methyltransferase [Candidatus Cyanaurora vandensis]|uniref:RsmE family RNA methyltransferase n=1 Tax=Candidatus Cyanaurora vandensis TaxID=2714958 RepID=UPI00257C1035|nr:RsmE family RNA methyltransferase [Candidatus Cyanaurora vandensis]
MGGPDLRSQLKNLPRLWGKADLTPAQVHYLKKVLRLRLGDPVILLDGQGGAFRGLWQGETLTELVALDHPATEPPRPIWLAVGVLKGEAMDWLIQKATELGVTTLQPLTTQYTQLTPSPHKQQRWQQIAQEACEQCERLFLPTILPVCSVARVTCPHRNFIAVARENSRPLATALGTYPPQPVGVWIGPEGGWGPLEQDELSQKGAEPVSLGPRILRAETAVCSALALVNSWLEGEASASGKEGLTDLR